MNLLFWLGLLFVGLKLLGVITWSWLWVTSPFWAWLMIWALAVVAVAWMESR